MYKNKQSDNQLPGPSRQASCLGKQSSGQVDSIHHSQPEFSSDTQPKISKIKEKIISRGISINNRELLIAVGESDLEKVKGIVEKGADVNFEDRDGSTVLHYAVTQGCEEVVDYLLNNGADIYLENNENKTAFDIAVNIKNENIIGAFGEKILDMSLEKIEKYKLKKNIVQDKNLHASSNSNEKSLFQSEKEKKQNEIAWLSKHLENLKLEVRGDEFSSVKANVFILFLEIFAFHNISDKKVKEYLIDTFFQSEKEEHKIIVDTRKFILKNKAVITLSDVEKIIESCCNKEASQGQSKVELFFNELKQYAKCKTQIDNNSQNDIKVNYFFKKFPETKERRKIGNRDTPTDPYEELKDLVLKAYKKEENMDQCWFEFVVNIYPALDLEGKKDEDINNIEKQLRHLRNNLVHGFYRFGIQEFREAIINLRGTLFEYYYAKTVHSKFKSLTPGKDIEEIKEIFNKDLEELRETFKDSEGFLSEEEARSLFGYKFVKSLFPKQSENNHDNAVKELVEEYFKYMSVVEDVNRINQDDDDKEEEKNVPSEKKLNNVVNNELSYKTLGNIARRELFEKFIRLKRIKENFTDEVYKEEKKLLMNDLRQYGVGESKFNLVCEYYLEEGNNFNEEISKVVENIVKFIENISQIKKGDTDYKEKEIVFLSDLILNKDIVEKELILSENSRLKNELKKKAENNYKIIQVIDQVESFSDVCMEINGVILQIDVRQTVKNMLRTFYNVYNEYRIEFDIEGIFSRESFLKELVWQGIKERRTAQPPGGNAELLDSNTFMIIYKLINIEYMSPYIVKLVESRIKEGREAGKVIDKDCLVKLIDNLLNKKEYVSYLNILLSVGFEGFNLYEKLYDKIYEKKVDIKYIRPIFEEFKHLEKFIDLLKLTDSKDEQQSKSIIKLTQSVLKIINEEAAVRLYCAGDYDEALKILEKGKEIQSRFEEVEAMEGSYPDFIDRDLLTIRINNRQGKYEEALKILNELKHKLESGASITHKTKFLLILSDIVYTNKLLKKRPNYDDLYSKIIKYIFYLDDVSEGFNVAQTVKEKYNQVKSLGRYKDLLSSSELLHSDRCLNILRIAADSAYQVMHFRNGEAGYNNALKIYEEIYSCYKEDLGKDHRDTILTARYIAIVNINLADICKNNERTSDAMSYYQSALIRYNLVYNAREKMFGPDHAAVIYIREIIVNTVRNIAYTHNKLGDLELSSSPGEALRHFKQALKIYEKVLEIQIKTLGEEHEHALNTRCDIALTNNYLGRLKWLDDNPEEALKHYKVARKRYEKVLEIQTRTLGEDHYKTNKTKKQLENTKKWMKWLCLQYNFSF